MLFLFAVFCDEELETLRIQICLKENEWFQGFLSPPPSCSLSFPNPHPTTAQLLNIPVGSNYAVAGSKGCAWTEYAEWSSSASVFAFLLRAAVAGEEGTEKQHISLLLALLGVVAAVAF